MTDQNRIKQNTIQSTCPETTPLNSHMYRNAGSVPNLNAIHRSSDLEEVEMSNPYESTEPPTSDVVGRSSPLGNIFFLVSTIIALFFFAAAVLQATGSNLPGFLLAILAMAFFAGVATSIRLQKYRRMVLLNVVLPTGVLLILYGTMAVARFAMPNVIVEEPSDPITPYDSAVDDQP